MANPLEMVDTTTTPVRASHPKPMPPKAVGATAAEFRATRI